MNPDGYEREFRGGRWSRTNAHGKDLNRNFPDQFRDNVDTDEGREPETAALMKWMKDNKFILSANLHGGAIVANYPWDGDPRSSSVSSHPPDLATFQHLALVYSTNHAVMHQGNSCGDHFTDGITEGYEWYPLYGGMQDYNYVYRETFELTLELSCRKDPEEKDLESYWNDNKASLVSYVEQVWVGLYGRVLDQNGNPVSGASIQIEGISYEIHTNAEGYFWRLLPPDSGYSLTASPPATLDGEPVTLNDLSVAEEAFPLQTPLEITLNVQQAAPTEVSDRPTQQQSEPTQQQSEPTNSSPTNTSPTTPAIPAATSTSPRTVAPVATTSPTSPTNSSPTESMPTQESPSGAPQDGTSTSSLGLALVLVLLGVLAAGGLCALVVYLRRRKSATKASKYHDEIANLTPLEDTDSDQSLFDPDDDKL
eukprot:NODE_496_length_1436_cov_90.151261_g462_i0.p1 GENE.NODE_496_length_1436_cov_90.151261_g462_i0~~NODE_496_length_1436_cov_90.151261_g462_i0.p1  ORF type:complete len:471 (-),score=69.38 NODE_496_length_1436_cov_90.151261_g462_i0:22-1293(-)